MLEIALLTPLLTLLLYGMLHLGLRALQRQRFEIGLDHAARAALSALTDQPPSAAAASAARALAWSLAGGMPRATAPLAAATALPERAAALRSQGAITVSICPLAPGWRLEGGWRLGPGGAKLRGVRRIPHPGGLPVTSVTCGVSS